ncbi:MAG: EpsG family protein [bacterium]
MFNFVCLTVVILACLSIVELMFPSQKRLSNQLYIIGLLTTAFLTIIKYYYGPDIATYVPMYEDIPLPSVILSPSYITDYEKGFLLFCSICNHYLHMSFWAMTMVIAVIYLTVIHLVINRLTNLKTFALFFLVFLQTNLIFVELRQCLAVSLFILSILSFEKKHYILYALCTLAAISLHKSALIVCGVSLFLLIVMQFRSSNTMFAISMLFLFVFIMIPLQPLLTYFVDYMPFSANIIKSIEHHLIISRKVQAVFAIYLLILYSLYIYFSRTNKLKTWHIITICGLLFISLFYQYWFFINRLRSYFLPIIITYVIMLGNNYSGKQLFFKQISIIAVYLLFFVNFRTMYNSNLNLKSGIAETSTIFKLRHQSKESVINENMKKAEIFWKTEYLKD